jgi:hypothetical protein
MSHVEAGSGREGVLRPCRGVVLAALQHMHVLEAAAADKVPLRAPRLVRAQLAQGLQRGAELAPAALELADIAVAVHVDTRQRDATARRIVVAQVEIGSNRCTEFMTI